MGFEKNQIYTVTIEDIGAEGEGIGKIEGFSLFVKDALPGDVAKVKLTKVRKNYAFARLEEIIKPSPGRVEPCCPVSRQCGGCQIQALSYGKQLAFKQSKVENNLVRIGGFEPEMIREIMEPIIGMESPWRYRNKAQYPFGCSKDGTPVTGFYAGRTHVIIPNTDCLLGARENKRILDTILKHMRQYQVAAYDEGTGQGLVRHVLVRIGHATGQIMVVLVLTSPVMPSKNNFMKALRELHPEITTIVINVNDRDTSMILGEKEYAAYGRGYIEDELCGMTFRISPKSFYQVNPVQTEKLYGKAMEYACLTGVETVLDAYCGTGTIGMIASRHAASVLGVELNRDAVRDAVNNAKQNQISNIRFYENDAGDFLLELAQQGGKLDVLFLDPPRSGSSEAFLNAAVRTGPGRIVYISCQPETLVRDLRILVRKGYKAEKCVAVDMFPYTDSIEAVVSLVREKRA